jgi:hypothetical protein
MNKNDFLMHLQTLEVKSKKPQNLWESKEEFNVNDLEDFVFEHIEYYVGDSLNESSSPEDINELVVECVDAYNEIYACILEYAETGDEELGLVVDEYLDSYFDGSLNEDVQEEEIKEAFDNLGLICEAFNLYFSE